MKWKKVKVGDLFLIKEWAAYNNLREYWYIFSEEKKDLATGRIYREALCFAEDNGKIIDLKKIIVRKSEMRAHIERVRNPRLVKKVKEQWFINQI